MTGSDALRTEGELLAIWVAAEARASHLSRDADGDRWKDAAGEAWRSKIAYDAAVVQRLEAETKARGDELRRPGPRTRGR